jgi:hypothetical protein
MGGLPSSQREAAEAQRMSGPTEDKDSFRGLLLKHWDAGTGLKRKAASWSAKEFADAMGRCGCPTSVDAIGNWLKGINTPRRPQVLAILDVFFLDPAFSADTQHPERQRMYDAWTEETRPGARRAREAEPSPPPAANAAEWPRENPKPVPGLAALELHTPQPDNTGGHHLRGRLDLGAREDDSTEQPIRLAMLEAFVTVETSANLVTDGSLIGMRDAHPHLKPEAGALRVIGPLGEDGHLAGEVFGGSHIAVLTCTEEHAAAEVTVTLAVPRRGFAVTPLDEEGAPKKGVDSAAKRAILNTLIFDELPKDEQGRAVLQKAKLRKRPKE